MFEGRSKIMLRYAFGALILTVVPAYGCPPGQYEDQTLHICLPGGNEVVKVAAEALNPLPNVVQLGDAVIHFDAAKVAQSVGDLVIKTSAPGAGIFANLVMDKNDKALVDQVVGRGWILWVSGNPVLLVATSEGTSVQQVALTTPPIVAPPVHRSRKTYKAAPAVCVFTDSKKVGRRIAAGWVTAPTLTDTKTGKSFTLPNVDLQPKDVIVVDAGKCPKSGLKTQHTIQHATLHFESAPTAPGTGTTTMKYFIVGNETV